MKKKHIILCIVILLLSAVHFFLSIYFLKLYAYFNVQNNLRTFVTAVRVFRYGIYGLTIVSGYLALKDQQRKLILFYLTFFVFNLMLPFLFSVG